MRNKPLNVARTVIVVLVIAISAIATSLNQGNLTYDLTGTAKLAS